MISICTGEHAKAASEWAMAWLATYRGRRPTYVCVLSFTDTGLIPDISAAGTTVAARHYTAAADGEFLLAAADDPPQTHPLRLLPRLLPPLAAGVSPAVISRAVLRSLSIPIHLLSTGLPTPLNVPHTALPHVQAQSVETGCAMSIAQAEALFSAGQIWGAQLAPASSYLIIGECVVGGTTTAQAVLTALGYEAAGRMSSSHLVGNHTQKQTVVTKGLAAWRQSPGYKHNSAIHAAAAVGDPMQLVVAGMLLAASQISGVLLAGGAQMLAVYALAKAIAHQKNLTWQTQQVVVGTTRWVIEDSHADTVAIAQQIKAPYLASQLSFRRSPYVQLRAYEQGFVKEGVGAGGCAIAAHLYKGWTESQLRHTTEAQLRYAF